MLDVHSKFWSSIKYIKTSTCSIMHGVQSILIWNKTKQLSIVVCEVKIGMFGSELSTATGSNVECPSTPFEQCPCWCGVTFTWRIWINLLLQQKCNQSKFNVLKFLHNDVYEPANIDPTLPSLHSWSKYSKDLALLRNTVHTQKKLAKHSSTNE